MTKIGYRFIIANHAECFKARYHPNLFRILRDSEVSHLPLCIIVSLSED